MTVQHALRRPQPAPGAEPWRHDDRVRRPVPQPLPRLDEGRRRALPPLYALPPAGWLGPWSDADKHAVVAAVRHGQVTLSRARADYALSLEEFAGWHEQFRLGPVMTPGMAERRVLLDEVREWLEP